jgi:hypothetical protein
VFEQEISSTRHALEEQVAHTRREQDEHRRRRAAS